VLCVFDLGFIKLLFESTAHIPKSRPITFFLSHGLGTPSWAFCQSFRSKAILWSFTWSGPAAHLRRSSGGLKALWIVLLRRWGKLTFSYCETLRARSDCPCFAFIRRRHICTAHCLNILLTTLQVQRYSGSLHNKGLGRSSSLDRRLAVNV
jgi:hypothetical protein